MCAKVSLQFAQSKFPEVVVSKVAYYSVQDASLGDSKNCQAVTVQQRCTEQCRKESDWKNTRNHRTEVLDVP